MKLTKRSVEGLTIEAKDYFVWDSEMAGFGVRVFASGRKSYLVQYRASGRSRRKSIGRHGVLTAEEARTEARKLLGDVAKGGNPAEERQQQLRAPHMASLCDRFIADYAAQFCKPSTQKSYAIMMRTCIKPFFGTWKIADVCRKDVVEFHHQMRDRPYMANRSVSVLSKMFNLAEDWGLRAEGSNPARRIKKYREEEKKRYLSDDEQMRLGGVLANALEQGEETPYVVAAIYLLMLTGCRLGEILTLQWDFVTAHHLELPDSKTGKRRIPLPREAHDVIFALDRRAGNPYVILGEAQDGHLVNLQKPWSRIKKAANLSDVRMHDLRHTYASVAVMNGIDPFMLKKIMGHKNLATTLRYSHFADEAVQRAASSVAGRLAVAMRPRKRDLEQPKLKIVS